MPNYLAKWSSGGGELPWWRWLVTTEDGSTLCENDTGFALRLKAVNGIDWSLSLSDISFMMLTWGEIKDKNNLTQSLAHSVHVCLRPHECCI